MTELRHVPVQLKKEQFLAVLDDIRASVEANDSFEGNIEWSFPEDWDNADFTVKAMYRVGNSQGQGGMRQIGSFQAAEEKTGE